MPLSAAAAETFEPPPESKTNALGITATRLEVPSRATRDRAGIVDVHFHDSRPKAITSPARKQDILDLARMIGHRDLKSWQIDYIPTPEKSRLGSPEYFAQPTERTSAPS